MTDRKVYEHHELYCPVCGEDGLDRMVIPPGRGDDAAVIVHPDHDDYDSPAGTRGGYVQIQLRCCAGHHFDLLVANHKGGEFLSMVEAPERQAADDPLPPPGTKPHEGGRGWGAYKQYRAENP